MCTEHPAAARLWDYTDEAAAAFSLSHEVQLVDAKVDR